MSAAARAALTDFAPAKINLTLHVIGRRPDGYHDLDSLVVFARIGDALSLTPGEPLDLVARGPTASAAGAVEDNLVLKAARALAQRADGLTLGRFRLTKRLPVAAGLGGGSSDAAAALRLLARANRLADGDARVMDAARATGADVPVCLDPRPRVMRGTGDVLSDAIPLPALPAVLVNPGVAVPTKDVFAALHARPSARPAEVAKPNVPCDRAALLAYLEQNRNDLEPAAIALQPVIAEVLAALRSLPHCRLARMSGAGATCFALFDSLNAAEAAARALRQARPNWWIRATMLGPAD